jgi:hypothetical protein
MLMIVPDSKIVPPFPTAMRCPAPNAMPKSHGHKPAVAIRDAREVLDDLVVARRHKLSAAGRDREKSWVAVLRGDLRGIELSPPVEWIRPRD